MNSKPIKKTKLTFEEFSKLLDFVWTCSHCGVDEYCECAKNSPNGCYCHDLHTNLMAAVTHYILREDLSLIIAVFQELEYSGFTMLDCADFIHRLNDKLPQLKPYYMSEQ
jgi:hypothetical protein